MMIIPTLEGCVRDFDAHEFVNILSREFFPTTFDGNAWCSINFDQQSLSQCEMSFCFTLIIVNMAQMRSIDHWWRLDESEWNNLVTITDGEIPSTQAIGSRTWFSHIFVRDCRK
jgi:hypothetical protein